MAGERLEHALKRYQNRRWGRFTTVDNKMLVWVNSTSKCTT